MPRQPDNKLLGICLGSIAQLNSQIQAIGASGGNTNELEDQCNQDIQNLSQQIGITYTENSNGTTNVNYTDGGGALVTGSQAGSFSLTTPNAPASNLYTVNLTPAGSTTAAAVSPVSGTLGATMDLINTVIPGYQSQVNNLASTIATAVNNLQTSGSDLNGNAGIALFNPAPPATATGATITVNPNFTTSNIAAAAGGSPAGSDDSSNALTIADLANSTTTMPGGQTFSNYYNSLVTQVGQDVQTSGNNVTKDQTYSNQLSTLQQSNSGVSLNKELINLTFLLQYKQVCLV